MTSFNPPNIPDPKLSCGCSTIWQFHDLGCKGGKAWHRIPDHLRQAALDIIEANKRQLAAKGASDVER